MEVKIAGEDLKLLPERAIFWKRKEMLILSDLHLGKAGHFRKHGIPVSKKVHRHDLHILQCLIADFEPKWILLLGDLFHSVANNEWRDFVHFMERHPGARFTLVQGNHDILDEYPPRLEVCDDWPEPPFLFTHTYQESEMYNLSGHIHPGIRVKGRGRQSITLPCFLFSAGAGILPAFGQFTGIKTIRPEKGDRVFGIANDVVMELPQVLM